MERCLKMTKSYLHFSETAGSRSGKTKTWDVLSKENVRLGVVKFHGPWRKYVFFCPGGMLFDEECLTDISFFVEDKNNIYKNKGKEILY